ncbi:hypothetical protein [Profundibacterium mesophilum]|uniref:Curlin associated repeat-containing protein n=1 Tax=Profundibacterium mesophilum KAUST100406-0324 TaxID=1037889 RepID=A0A921P0W2_9RHOB|nr:hypothetical protein [Profundibacterium mesophilum]KAF0677153.1 hypothetical protein PMES_00469 [Profundibacterium mesophilum KAUST100406-0324]
MNSKTLLASAAVIAVMAGNVQANEIVIDQAGNAVADIEQTGTGNTAGSRTATANGTAAATQRHRITQGANSTLKLIQSGDGNTFGSRTDGSRGIQHNGRGLGVDQLDGTNSATVSQLSSGNDIFSLYQFGNNTATVTQSGASGTAENRANLIDDIYQRNAAGGTANSLAVTQTRTDIAYTTNFTNFNRIGFDGTTNQRNGITQNGAGNGMVITQTGNANYIQSARQVGDTNTSNISMTGNNNWVFDWAQQGTDNTMTLSVTGDDNRGGTGIGGGARHANDQLTSFRQIGDGNSATMMQNGDRNRIGLNQSGNGNTVGTIMVTGRENQLGIKQGGATNTVALGAITSDENTFGVRQVGDMNRAALASTGSGSSSILFEQLGNSNEMSVSLDGFGNGKNGAAMALTESSTLNRAMHLNYAGNLRIGGGGATLHQKGDGNSLDYNVDGNDNLYTMVQDGGSNEIEGSTNGNSNEIAVWQSGGSNLINFDQMGSSNALAIRQGS